MASYSVAATEIGAYNKTLSASAVDTVTFATPRSKISIYTDGASRISVTFDGTAPTADGAATYTIPPAAGVAEFTVPAKYVTANMAVKLISAGTPVYSVWGD